MKTRLGIAILAALVSFVLSAPAFALDRSVPMRPDLATIVDDPDPSGYRYGYGQVGPTDVGRREAKGTRVLRPATPSAVAVPGSLTVVLEVRTPRGVRLQIVVLPLWLAGSGL